MDELVKALRFCGKCNDAMECDYCEYNNTTEYADRNCSDRLMLQAADAIEQLISKLNHADAQIQSLVEAAEERRWIPVTERLPSDFVSVQAHIVGAEPLPTVREAYVIGGKWFFPALKEFLPVDMWKRFDEPPKEE